MAFPDWMLKTTGSQEEATGGVMEKGASVATLSVMVVKLPIVWGVLPLTLNVSVLFPKTKVPLSPGARLVAWKWDWEKECPANVATM